LPTSLSASRLHLNPAKTILIWFGSRQQIDKVTICDITVLSSSATAVDTAQDLSMIVDSQLTISAKSAVCVSRGMDTYSCSNLSRVPLAKATLFSISDNLLWHLQAVQNAAACLITGTRRPDHKKSILRQFHWVPMQQHIEFRSW